MSEDYFWEVYFVLLRSRLNKHDAELLSKSQGNWVWKDFNIKKGGQWDLFPSCSEGFPGSDFNNHPTSRKIKIGLIVGNLVLVGVVSCLFVLMLFCLVRRRKRLHRKKAEAPGDDIVTLQAGLIG